MAEMLVLINVLATDLLSKFNLELSKEAMTNIILLVILFVFMSILYGIVMWILTKMEEIGNKRFAKYHLQRVSMSNRN